MNNILNLALDNMLARRIALTTTKHQVIAVVPC